MITKPKNIQSKTVFMLLCFLTILCITGCIHRLGRDPMVKDLNGLFKKLDSSCAIQLSPGMYNTSALDTGIDGRFFRWSYYFEGRDDGTYEPALTFCNMNNITFKGKGTKPEETKIYSTKTDAIVIVFENCKNVVIDNLWFGHISASESCLGGVLCFVGCENVTINRTHMYGTGYYGFEVYEAKKIICTQSEIFGCSGGTFGTIRCDSVKIDNCSFYNNSSYGHFCSFVDCPCTIVDSCIFRDNNIYDSALDNQALFSSWNSNVVVRNSKIYNNLLESMIWRNPGSNFTMKNIDSKDNTITDIYEEIYR